jgi:hypothetical protein
MRRAHEVIARMDAMNPVAVEEMQDFLQSLSTEDLKALRAELARRIGGAS